MIGGSSVRIGTRFDVTLPGALKRMLQARYPGADMEVINGGIISAISRQELIFVLTTLVDYALDILLVYDGINDSGQMLYYERRPNFPYNYRVIEEAWTQYVTGRRDPLWRLVLHRSAILPTSLYALFPKDLGQDDRSRYLHTNLYANYLVYEDFRKTAQEFSEAHPELGVLDLSSFLPAEAFFDGDHVYDDVNDLIAEKLADFIANDIDRMR